MFRLPVCPHCGAVYRYNDTKKAIKEKRNECYHCKKSFTVKLMPYILVHSLPLAVLCIAVNIMLLSRMKELELLPLFIITVAFILLIWLLIPFFLSFKKIDKSDK